jgi:hypothetical protein
MPTRNEQKVTEARSRIIPRMESELKLLRTQLDVVELTLKRFKAVKRMDPIDIEVFEQAASNFRQKTKAIEESIRMFVSIAAERF